MKIRIVIYIVLLVTVFTARTASAETGAKGLYFEQIAHPQKHLNTGIRYWIELKRHGITTPVNNKVTFHFGDKIRFHVKPNIDGYAYILLTSGSRGEQSVLFPAPNNRQNNIVKAGTEYVLPAEGSFVFDNNPGIEKLTLLLSRRPIDAEAYLHKKYERTIIASAESGSKDLVMPFMLLAYAPPPATPALINEEPPTVARQAISVNKTKMAVLPKAAYRRKHVPSVGTVGATFYRDPIVTVVSKVPNGMMALDIALAHI